MKKYIVLIMVFLVTLPAALAQEDDAGILGPEHGIFYALDIVLDNILTFASRIGGEDTKERIAPIFRWGWSFLVPKIRLSKGGS